MEVDFDDKRVRKGGVFDSNDKFDLTISWDNDKKKLYTLVFFDLDAPYPDESDIPYIHYLVINVPGDNIEKGKTVLEYKPPSPPKDSPPHEYIVQLYEQPTKINVGKVERRSNLDELLPSDLILLQELNFHVANRSLEHRFCTCILHTEARNHSDCKKGKCYNPYAICAASVGTTAKNCSKYYDFKDLNDEELRAYARLFGVKYGEKDDNKTIIENILKKKELENKI